MHLVVHYFKAFVYNRLQGFFHQDDQIPTLNGRKQLVDTLIYTRSHPFL
jgi:hypothetical protein